MCNGLLLCLLLSLGPWGCALMVRAWAGSSWSRRELLCRVSQELMLLMGTLVVGGSLLGLRAVKWCWLGLLALAASCYWLRFLVCTCRRSGDELRAEAPRTRWQRLRWLGGLWLRLVLMAVFVSVTVVFALFGLRAASAGDAEPGYWSLGCAAFLVWSSCACPWSTRWPWLKTAWRCVCISASVALILVAWLWCTSPFATDFSAECLLGVVLFYVCDMEQSRQMRSDREY